MIFYDYLFGFLNLKNVSFIDNWGNRYFNENITESF